MKGDKLIAGKIMREKERQKVAWTMMSTALIPTHPTLSKIKFLEKWTRRNLMRYPILNHMEQKQWLKQGNDDMAGKKKMPSWYKY